MSMKKKFLGVTLAAVLATAVSAGMAQADQFSNGSEVHEVVGAGTGPHFDADHQNATGIYPTVTDFAGVTLNGNPQLTSATIVPFTIIDASGSGSGWHVTLTLPSLDNGVYNALTNADCSGGSTHTLDATGASMNAPVVTTGTSDTLLGTVQGYDNGDFTTAKVIVDTGHRNNALVGADEGMGTYLVSPQILKLVVPSNTYAGNYCTTATIAITNTP